MKMNGPERSKLRQGRSTWQWVKHARLYSELLQALKGESLSALVLNREDLNFCVRSTPLRGSQPHKQKLKEEEEEKKTERKTRRRRSGRYIMSERKTRRRRRSERYIMTMISTMAATRIWDVMLLRAEANSDRNGNRWWGAERKPNVPIGPGIVCEMLWRSAKAIGW